MLTGRRLLRVAGLATAAASLLHLVIIIGGPDWYRFFGAGEGMARLAASGSVAPTVVTGSIAAMLLIWALYAFSGAGDVKRLPLLRLALLVIAAVFLTRGLLGMPLVLLGDGPYLDELKGRLVFMIVTSVVCVVLGLCYAAGAATVHTAATDRRPGSRT
ncbi:MAG: hypothetical protein MUE41_08980 [Gemmatimonadaceae bacterium]|nr:hypothetical protein [Gemmatimonadaceae bacterium]